MKKEHMAIAAGCLLLFYMGIMMYVLFPVLRIDTLKNCECSILFESIGFLLLTWVILSNILSPRIKTGFLVPIIMVTVIYTVILHGITIVCAAIMPPVFFILLHVLILFLYCLLSMPMYIMGKR